MGFHLKYKKTISIILCAVMISSILGIHHHDSYGETDKKSSPTPSNESIILEQKIEEPVRNSEYDGFIVTIKDQKIDQVGENEVAEATPSTDSEKYYLIETTKDAITLASASAIETVEPNYKRYAYDVYPPNDPYYKKKNNFGTTNNPNYIDGPAKAFPQMGIDVLWKNDLHGEGVHVAILDTGINSHRDLDVPEKILSSPDLESSNLQNSAINNDLGGHGTMVTSVIKGKYNNAYNIAGIADKAKITSINVFTRDQDGELYATSFQTMNAYEYLLKDENTPDIINCSYGGSGNNNGEDDLLEQLAAKGCIILAANGNDGKSVNHPSNPSEYSPLSYPAAYPSTIGVGATDADGKVTDFSSKNTSVDVSAWGKYVTVVNPNNKSGTSGANGTSFSSPVVAGIAACLKQQYPGLDKDLFLQLIKDTSADKGVTGKDVSYGYGIINAAKILDKISDYVISYVTDGGEWNGEHKTTYRYSTSETPLPLNITKGGSTFKGWYTDEKLTDGPYTTIPPKKRGNLKLYAKWGTTTEIKFNTGVSTAINPISLDIGKTYGSLPVLPRTGYTLDGWYIDPGFKNKISQTTKVSAFDHTVYAKWNANPQNIVFNDRGKLTSSTYKYDSQLINLPKPTRKGYTFSGWFTAAKGGSKAGNSTVVQSNMTLFARWSPKTYKIKYNVNKGKKLKKKSKKIIFDKKYGKLPKPKRKGYKFRGWYTKKKGGVKITAKKKMTTAKVHTLYARWKKK